jgi:hypothetical protein
VLLLGVLLARVAQAVAVMVQVITQQVEMVLQTPAAVAAVAVGQVVMAQPAATAVQVL